MKTHVHFPAYPLNQFIDHFFYYRNSNVLPSIERFLPDGEVQVVIDLTDEPKHIYDNNSLAAIQTCKQVWFSGFRTSPITIPTTAESEMLIIQFKKGMTAPFISSPMGEITNQVVDAELVLNCDIISFREQIGEASSPDLKCLVLEKNLINVHLKHFQTNPYVSYAISAISSIPNQTSLKELARKVGYTQKHMIKIFRDHVGVTPKEFLKVIRFQKAIEEIEKRKSTKWTDIAFDCGYYDQSHFISNFKSFSGLTPGEYLLQKGEHLNYIPVGLAR